MLDSFAVISSELRTLAENLRNAEELRAKLQREREEADARVREARAAAAEAESARQLAERLAVETLEEARRLAILQAAKEEEERLIAARHEVATAEAQTETVDGGEGSVVERTITQEIRIVQKVGRALKLTNVFWYPDFSYKNMRKKSCYT